MTGKSAWSKSIRSCPVGSDHGAAGEASLCCWYLVLWLTVGRYVTASHCLSLQPLLFQRPAPASPPARWQFCPSVNAKSPHAHKRRTAAY